MECTFSQQGEKILACEAKVKKLEAQYSIKNGQGKSSKGGKPASSSSQNQSSGNGASPNRL